MELWRIKNRLTDIRRRTTDTAKKIGKKTAEEVKSIAKWVMENPDKAAAIAGTGAALAGGANKVIRSYHRNVTLRKAEKEKRTRVYDHSLNAYVYTKKPLTKEQIEFIHKERRRTGKKVSEIMAEMDILRK